MPRGLVNIFANHIPVVQVSKHGLYIVKQSIEIFGTGINEDRALLGHIRGQLLLFFILIISRAFWIDSSVGDFPSRNDPWSSLFILQFFVIPSTCEVYKRKRTAKSPESAKFLEFVIKRRSANSAWRPNFKGRTKNGILEKDDEFIVYAPPSIRPPSWPLTPGNRAN